MNRPPPRPEDLSPKPRAASGAPSTRPPAGAAAAPAGSPPPKQPPPAAPTVAPSTIQPAISAPSSSDRLIPTDPPLEPRRRRRFGILGKFVIFFVVIALAWTAWAAAAFYDLRNGLENGDAVALERRIDWLRVRDGLRDDLLAGRATGGSPLDAARVDPMTSRTAVAHLLRTAKLNESGWDTTSTDAKKAGVFGWYRIRSAFFSGGPFAFYIEVSPDSDTFRRPFILLFQWTGDWRLTRIFLPADAGVSAAARAASAEAKPEPKSELQPALMPAPATKPAPPDAQRVVLFEEDPADPNGKRSTGWVSWRVDQTPATAGGSAEPAITAEVNVPERALSLTMTIRRNLDKALPASHTIELKFVVPAGQPTRGILDVAAIQMKPNDEVAGLQLAGSRVKVSNDFFLMGLSAIDMDVQSNLQMLKDRPWVGILFVYSSNSRAVLSIEKGDTGRKIIADTLAQWQAVSSAASAGPR